MWNATLLRSQYGRHLSGAHIFSSTSSFSIFASLNIFSLNPDFRARHPGKAFLLGILLFKAPRLAAHRRPLVFFRSCSPCRVFRCSGDHVFFFRFVSAGRHFGLRLGGSGAVPRSYKAWGPRPPYWFRAKERKVDGAILPNVRRSQVANPGSELVLEKER